MRSVFVLFAVLAVAVAGLVEKRSLVDCSLVKCETPACDNPIYTNAHCCGLCPSPNPNLSKCALVLCAAVLPGCEDPIVNNGHCCGKCAEPVCKFGTNNEFCGGIADIPCDDPNTECVLEGDFPDAGGQCCFTSKQKPGKCPKPDDFAICPVQCHGDEDCDGDDKCCHSGCGHVCTTPE